MLKFIILLSLLINLLYADFSLGGLKSAYNKYNHYKEKYEHYKKSSKQDSSASQGLPFKYPKKNNTILKKKIFQALDCDNVYSNLVVDTCYSNYFKGSLATAYHIDGNLVYAVNLKEGGRWHYNKAIPKQYRSSNEDYAHNRWDKGHLSMDSAYDYNQRVLNDTYDLNINAIPQLDIVNRKLWIMAEAKAKRDAKRLNDVDIIDVVYYGKNPKRMGRNKIGIPKGFLKIIYNNKKGYKECYYYENKVDNNWRRDTLQNHKVRCNVAFNSLGIQ